MLLPCPFCGSSATLRQDKSDPRERKWRWEITCNGEYCDAAMLDCSTAQQATERWNRRQDDIVRKAWKCSPDAGGYWWVRMPVITGAFGEFEGCYQTVMAMVKYTSANLWEMQTLSDCITLNSSLCAGFQFWGPLRVHDIPIAAPEHANFP